MILNATPGDPLANTYSTVAAATAVLTMRLDTAAWDEASLPDQEAALQWATRLIDEQVQWYGMPTYGPAVARLASIEYCLKTENQAQGAERVSFTIVYFDATFPLSSRDKLTLPDGTSPAIEEVGSKVDPDYPGVTDHYRVVL